MIFGFALLVSLLGQSNSADTVRLYEGLGTYHRMVSTKVPLASRYLDQGIDFLYGFQYRQSEASFKEAARLDPHLVLAYWGIAAANGNYINSPEVPPSESKAAIEALAKAKSIRSWGTDTENDLIDAALQRFSPEGPTNRAKLDQAYSDAMRRVWQAHPNDPDVGALFAESLLNLRPWKQWTLDGKPEPGTEEALATLREVLNLDPKHPQGLHLWIHTIEGSKDPIRALPEANKLMDLQPGLMHMQHMPAHIYDRTGNWKQAVEANIKSTAVYKRLFWHPGTGLDYGHGRHLLCYAAAMRGQSELTLQNASQVLSGLTPEQTERIKYQSDYYVAMKSMFLVRFGRWAEILALPEPPKSLKFARAMWHEARGVSFAAQKETKSALIEQFQFKEAKLAALGEKPDPDIRDSLEIADHVLAGEVLVSAGKSSEGVNELQTAVETEDHMEYTEPPTWIQPTRHTLGAALLDANRFAEAVKVYQEDLRQHPNNGWALYGLSRAYQGLGKQREANRTMAEFKRAWVDADMEISSSCMCLPAKKKSD